MFNKWKILTATIVIATLHPNQSYAQDDQLERRVNKLEKEVQAVQRKVFPNKSDRFFEPEITPNSPKPNTVQSENNDNAALRDLLGRVNALEEQLATLTGQVEEQQFKMRSVESKLAELDTAIKAQQKAAEEAHIPITPAAEQETSISETAPKAVSAEKRNQVAAIEVPDTGDAFEDNYNYGFRLWDKKFYPEAQAQLQETIDTFPNHARISFARNLLGRAWLDDKKPRTAAKVFYDNYKNNPRGGRAPDSLYFLGVALASMEEFSKSCEAYDQLESAYPDTAEGRLATRLSKGRTEAKCP